MIIGVIVALTLSLVIENYQKSRIETKLLYFSSTMNQAMQMLENDNGTIPDVFVKGNYNLTYNQNLETAEQYIFPYLKVIKYNRCSINSNYVCIYLANGDLFGFAKWGDGTDLIYYINGKYILPENRNTRNAFNFQFNKYNSSLNKRESLHYVEPYTARWNGNIEDLKKGQFGCHKNSDYFAYCTKLIELNGWKIPKDYPW